MRVGRNRGAKRPQSETDKAPEGRHPAALRSFTRSSSDPRTFAAPFSRTTLMEVTNDGESATVAPPHGVLGPVDSVLTTLVHFFHGLALGIA